MTFPTADRVLFGAAYYHEYHQNERLDTDLDLMVEAGFSVIRVGESVWSTWEPENGTFDLDWIQPVLDGAFARGLKVILGTPTYAAPMWLARTYPEINVRAKTGQEFGWGQRQEIDYSHPAFLFHAERLVRKIFERYAEHPAIIGFQVDNEPGFHVLYNDSVFQRFIDHLRKKYGTVDVLNEEWGLTYWSHKLSTWADLWRPDANLQPQYDLAWRRFQAELTTSFISWQADIAREYASPQQFVTTCISYDRKTVQDEALGKALDRVSANLYYRMQDQLALPGPRDVEQSWTTTGTAALYWSADRVYGSRQEPFMITETNAQAISHQWQNEPGFDGQWRQVAWALVSRGASLVEYWHWHSNVYGTETYWGGVLPHSLKPGRVYREIARIGAELAAAGEEVVDLIPDADVVFLYSNESKWALAENPQLGGYRGANPRGYQRILEGFHDGAFHAGLQTRIMHPEQLLGNDPAQFAVAQPLLVAAGYLISDDAVLQWLGDYATAGGHLILGPRTGYEDQEGRARTLTQPALLADLAQLSYDEFSTLDLPLPVQAEGPLKLHLAGEAAAEEWADGLVLAGAEALAIYDHPHFGKWAAVSTTNAGSGRVTYVGTVPNRELASAVFSWANATMRDAAEQKWVPQNGQQTVTGARNRKGQRLRFVHNWGWEPSQFLLGSAIGDVISGEELTSGSTIELGPWDVRVLRELS